MCDWKAGGRGGARSAWRGVGWRGECGYEEGWVDTRLKHARGGVCVYRARWASQDARLGSRRAEGRRCPHPNAAPSARVVLREKGPRQSPERRASLLLPAVTRPREGHVPLWTQPVPSLPQLPRPFSPQMAPLSLSGEGQVGTPPPAGHWALQWVQPGQDSMVTVHVEVNVDIIFSRI